MPVTSSELIEFAEQLDTSASEAAIRAAISRAYYGVYHQVVAWHQALPYAGHDIGPRGGNHQVLINQLTNPDRECDPTINKQSRGIGYALRELRGSRVQADYELSITLSAEDAANACAKARALLNRAK